MSSAIPDTFVIIHDSPLVDQRCWPQPVDSYMLEKQVLEIPSAKHSRDIAVSPLPDLLISGNRTNSSALHMIRFSGPLLPWTGFTTAVKNAYDTQQWSRRVIQISIEARDLTNEKIFVGDEAGVYAQFQQAAR
ncbi:hypothetical protein N7495_000487 [Penicillium taxi]|uniref:uncharacterized protein n=1 Tax=Penicillium taxi TaxID=168475 RepID=UPI0025459D67|nr:uncharacterized protein N7495_000487 [Penicillium taxi]KAJ5907805.1 hypothetical protein N7495_000487 [Penicillium taxi]